jgi:hypothetical protein
VQVREVGRRKRRAARPEVPGEEGKELREIALVRANGMGRSVFVEPQVIEKLFQVICHGSTVSLPMAA